MTKAELSFDFKNPDYNSIFAQRVKRLTWLRENPEQLPALHAFYKKNIAQFILDWGMTSDTRNADIGLPVVIPFILFQKQIDWVGWLLERWKGRESGLTEKSRDMGLTWLTVAVAASICLFYKDINIGFGSRKEEYIDKSSDPKSIFYKARQFISLLPPEFNGGWQKKRDSSHMLIRLPGTGSTLTGEAGDNIGRGNRASIYFKDESAFYERPEMIDASLSQTSNCKIDISTPHGTGNPFHTKRMSGKISVFTFHWKDDPRKDEAWYKKQQDELDPVTVAQELDIDYAASVEGVCIPGKWIRAAINLHEVMGLLPSGSVRVGFDVADEQGKDFNVVTSATGTVIQEIESWNDVDTYQSTHKAGAFSRTVGASYVNYDSIGVGAGVRGDSKALPLNFNAINVASKDLEGNVLGSATTLNRDFYLNLRAQLWWEMRIRCQRAYQHINKIRQWSLDEMVSLPNHPKLITELGQPLVHYDESGSGKLQIESKKKMKTRGIPSPNYADSALLIFAPVQLRNNIQTQQTEDAFYI